MGRQLVAIHVASNLEVANVLNQSGKIGCRKRSPSFHKEHIGWRKKWESLCWFVRCAQLPQKRKLGFPLWLEFVAFGSCSQRNKENLTDSKWLNRSQQRITGFVTDMLIFVARTFHHWKMPYCHTVHSTVKHSEAVKIVEIILSYHQRFWSWCDDGVHRTVTVNAAWLWAERRWCQCWSQDLAKLNKCE